PIAREPNVAHEYDGFGANDFATPRPALSLLDELAGSDSNPSEDNYEPEELESNAVWQAFRRSVVLRRSSALKSASAGSNSGRTASLMLSSSLAKKTIKLRKKVRRSSSTGTPHVTASDVRNAGGFAQFHKNMIQRRIHQAQIVMQPPPP
ncbi:hypothetical protein SPRG_12457, partial [Saprolegnia parasitica CBS 223.65]